MTPDQKALQCAVQCVSEFGHKAVLEDYFGPEEVALYDSDESFKQRFYDNLEKLRKKIRQIDVTELA